MSDEEVIRVVRELGIVLTDQDFAAQEDQGAPSDDELTAWTAAINAAAWFWNRSAGRQQ